MLPFPRPFVLGLFAVLTVLTLGQTATADLGSCIVLQHVHSDPELCKHAASELVRAHESSPASDGHIVFILQILSPYEEHPEGSYIISPTELGSPKGAGTRGYELQAFGKTGIENGVAEFVKGFAEGRIYEIKHGERRSRQERPHYRE